MVHLLIFKDQIPEKPSVPPALRKKIIFLLAHCHGMWPVVKGFSIPYLLLREHEADLSSIIRAIYFLKEKKWSIVVNHITIRTSKT